MKTIFTETFEARMIDDFIRFSNDERYVRYDLRNRIFLFVRRYKEYDGRQLILYKIFMEGKR